MLREGATTRISSPDFNLGGNIEFINRLSSNYLKLNSCAKTIGIYGFIK